MSEHQAQQPGTVPAAVPGGLDDLARAQASRCYAEDTCTLDDACPFVIDCLQAD